MVVHPQVTVVSRRRESITSCVSVLSAKTSSNLSIRTSLHILLAGGSHIPFLDNHWEEIVLFLGNPGLGKSSDTPWNCWKIIWGDFILLFFSFLFSYQTLFRSIPSWFCCTTKQSEFFVCHFSTLLSQRQQRASGGWVQWQLQITFRRQGDKRFAQGFLQESFHGKFPFKKLKDLIIIKWGLQPKFLFNFILAFHFLELCCHGNIMNWVVQPECLSMSATLFKPARFSKNESSYFLSQSLQKSFCGFTMHRPDGNSSSVFNT